MHLRTRIRTIVALIGIVAVLGIAIGHLLWIFSPSIESWHIARAGIQAIERHQVSGAIENDVVYCIDTADHMCTGDKISKHYLEWVDVLARHSPALNTYLWADEVLFYPRVSTVAQFTNGFIEVRAAKSNDNASVSILFEFGQFERPRAKEIAGPELPRGFFDR